VATSEAVFDAVVSFVKEAAVGPVLVAGCSYGGYLAAGLARRHPELVRGLLLVSPGVIAAPTKRHLPSDVELTSEKSRLAAAPPELHTHFDLAVARRSASSTTFEFWLAAGATSQYSLWAAAPVGSARSGVVSERLPEGAPSGSQSPMSIERVPDEE